MGKNRIFPPWSEIPNLKVKLTRGEEFLAKYLDSNLPTDWNIYLKTEFEWGGGKTPDIVIAHKSKGIMIFEVNRSDLIVVNAQKKAAEEFEKERKKRKKDYISDWFRFIELTNKYLKQKLN